MFRRSLFSAPLLAVAVFAAACSETAQQRNPLSPSATSPLSAADTIEGLALKATTPVPVSPRDGVRLESRTPTYVFRNAAAQNISGVAFTYTVEVLAGSNVVFTYTVNQGSGAETSFSPTDELQFDTAYTWRVRANFQNDNTSFSDAASFRTPEPPRPTAPSGGSFPTRSISPAEALSIIIAVHDGERADLGRNSTRESRIAFWQLAVGIVHYGHAVYNPLGGDPDWCIKDAGGGRPISDDVISRCSNRDSWDTIGGAGANGYTWHLEYLGRLPSGQNIYPPPPPPGAAPAGARQLPDQSGVVRALAAQFPALLQNSCQTGGGTWEFVDLVVDTLRRTDPNWAYNGKRGDVNNPAGDELSYYYGPGSPTPGSTQVYLIDIIESHCGAVPRPTWRPFSNEPGAWVTRGRF